LVLSFGCEAFPSAIAGVLVGVPFFSWRLWRLGGGRRGCWCAGGTLGRRCGATVRV